MGALTTPYGPVDWTEERRANLAVHMLIALKEFDAAFAEFDPDSFKSRSRMRIAVVKARSVIAAAEGRA